MAAPLGIVLTALELAQNERVLKGAQKLWERTPWGRDRAKVARANEGAERLLADVRGMARTLGARELEPAVEKRLAQFEHEVAEIGTPESSAHEIVAALKERIEDTVVGPIRELRAYAERLEAAEGSARAATEAVFEMRREIAGLKRVAVAAVGVAVVALLLVLRLLLLVPR